jgi:NAD(P)-dependent dehydrogenase (short-subunit alcohol dehydrogenase family)
MRLNLTAQINLVNGALPRMRVGGRIVSVTSHLALYGTESFAARDIFPSGICDLENGRAFPNAKSCENPSFFPVCRDFAPQIG